MPNLYTILIGPSGLGKGQAIDTALRFVKDLPDVNMYRGKASPPFLIDYLARRKKVEGGKKIIDNSKLYLVTPELSMSVGGGPMADAFVKLMSELYGGGDYTFQEGTRTRGGVQFKNHCVSWLAGSVIEWIMDSIPKEAIQGGFFARTITIQAPYNLENRHFEPQYPEDIDEVVEHIKARFKVLLRIGGEFKKSADARRIEEQWYNSRPAPDEEALIPAWKRDHDMLLKLAMILSLADGFDLIIEARHMAKAQQLVAEARRNMPDIVDFASINQETDGLVMVRKLIKEAKRIPHSTLLRMTSRKGIIGQRLETYIKTLVQEKRISIAFGERGGKIYVWTSGRSSIHIKEKEEKEDGSNTEGDTQV